MVYYSSRLDKTLTRYRIGMWRLTTLAIFTLLLVGQTRWNGSAAALAMVALGVVAVSIATVGRLWCALYISGRKNTALVTQGPYSVCRHPLYVCNFIGLMGLGLMTESLLVVGILMALFLISYPAVIRTEDQFLCGRFPEFKDYLQKTPAFWPQPSLYRTESTWSVDVKVFLRNAADSIWFLLGCILIETIDRAHELGWLSPRVSLF